MCNSSSWCDHWKAMLQGHPSPATKPNLVGICGIVRWIYRFTTEPTYSPNIANAWACMRGRRHGYFFILLVGVDCKVTFVLVNQWGSKHWKGGSSNSTQKVVYVCHLLNGNVNRNWMDYDLSTILGCTFIGIPIQCDRGHLSKRVDKGL